jgi:N-acetylglutamate synthase-like GNAT family acetyltransferase
MGAIIRDAKNSDLNAINMILETNGQIADVELDEIKDVVVAEVNGLVVGCGMCKKQPEGFEISKISVLPESQSKGIGMEMVMTLLGRTSGEKCWLLSVNSHDFWELFDFEKITEDEEPSKFREQCAGCSKKASCDRVVMFRDSE